VRLTHDLTRAAIGYMSFIVWGSVLGFIAYLILINLFHTWTQVRLAMLENVFIGGLASAVTFGLLLKASHGLKALGFLIVGFLIPFAFMTLDRSLFYSGLDLATDPLTVAFIFVWSALLLPFTMISATIYYFVPRRLPPP
jgi:hypothetical protein